MRTLKRKKKHDNGLVKLDKEIVREIKLFRRFSDENHLLFTGFVLLLGAMVIINTTYVINHYSAPQSSNAQHEPSYIDQVLNSGLLARTPAYNAVINNVYETAKTDYAFPIESDQTMLIMNITITNNLSSAADFYPVNQLFIRDQEGGTYAPHASMYVTKPIAAQQIPPQTTVTGQISFAIPKRLARPLLYVDLGWGNQVPVVFDVLR